MAQLTQAIRVSPGSAAQRRGLLALVLGVMLIMTVISPLISDQSTKAAGAIPNGLPNYIGLGLSNGGGGTNWMRSSGVPWNYRYQYLAGGANTGSGWANWNANGDFATYYMQDSATNGYIPVFSYYQLLQSAPATGANEGEKLYNNLNNAQTMNAYFADFKLLMDKIRASGKPAIVQVEADMFGFMQQRVINSTNSAASIPAKVGSSGYAAVADLPDTFQGFNWALLKLRDTYAPNAILAAHVSGWSTGIDIGSNSDPRLDLASVIAKTVAFHKTAGITGNPSGISSYDLLFFDPLDRDAAFYQYVYGDGGARWWDTTNQKFPNFNRYEQYLKGITDGLQRRAMLWQVPIGNTIMRTMNNTWGHYQDNRVQYWLGGYPQDGRLQALAQAGVIGVLFGRGADGPTTYDDASGDGVTNPAAINGNTQTATVADDDGGYLRLVAGRYYQSGPYRFDSAPVPTAPAGSTSTPVPAPTQQPAPTPTTVPNDTVTLPGRFEAEAYRSGGEGTGYHDTTPGNAGGTYRNDDVDVQTCNDGSGCYNVGWVTSGEWLAYNANVTATKNYVFTVRVATPNTGTKFRIEVDGKNVSGSITVPRTGGWNTWANVASPSIPLSAGAHTIKLVAETTGINWNYVSVK